MGEDATSIAGPGPERIEVAIPKGLVELACASHPIRVHPSGNRDPWLKGR